LSERVADTQRSEQSYRVAREVEGKPSTGRLGYPIQNDCRDVVLVESPGERQARDARASNDDSIFCRIHRTSPWQSTT
jgi:hypothetical protein